MGDIVIFRHDGTVERTWVPKAEEEWWIRFWGRGGIPAARLRDYRRWGGFFPRLGGFGGSITLRPAPRKRTDYRRWHAPEQGYQGDY